MSRAAWAAVIMLGAVTGLTFFMLTRGLDAKAVEGARKELARVDTVKKAIADARAELQRLAKKHPASVKGRPELAEALQSVEQSEKALAGLSGRVETIEAVIKANSYQERAGLDATVGRLGDELGRVEGGLAKPLGKVRKLVEYEQRAEEFLTSANRAVLAAGPVPADESLQTAYTLARAACPTAQSKLEKRWGVLAELHTLVKQKGAAVGSVSDVVERGKICETIIAAAQKLTAARAGLQAAFAALNTSVDKILIDMKTEGNPPRYFHKYRIVESGVERKSGWQAVSASEYQSHRDHLGMAIFSKPECTLPEDAVKTGTPPGYNYVGNRRYGRWEGSGSGRFWVFYGQYSLMRDLLWGRGYYRPVYHSSWRNYDASRRAGRTWYGDKRQFGTSGTQTRSRFASSRFMTRRRSSSTYGSSSSSSRSGSSYRSSRYRSSSRSSGK